MEYHVVMRTSLNERGRKIVHLSRRRTKKENFKYPKDKDEYPPKQSKSTYFEQENYSDIHKLRMPNVRCININKTIYTELSGSKQTT